MFSARLQIQNQFDNPRINVRYSLLVLAPIILSYVCVQPSSSVWNSTFSGIASFVLAGWHFALRVVGTSLGIGLGLGLAGHVYDVLSDAASTSESTSRAPKSSWGSYTANSGPQQVTRDIRPHAMDDDNSYHALMRSAGYIVDSSSLRGQMINGPRARDAMAANDAKRELMTIKSSSQPQRSNVQHHRISMYQFDRGGKASSLMRRMWPNLSPLVNDGLAKLTEFVLRDYVSSWYSKVDENLVYTDPTKETTVLAPLVNSDGMNARVSLRANSSFSEGDAGRPRRASPSTSQRRRDQHDPSFRSPYSTLPNESNHQQRTMILTTTGLQQSPFIESLYGCFAYLFGMMATRASENVNVLDLLLIKFPSLLSQNLRVYRLMRQSALEKKRRRIVQERERYRKLEREQRGVDGSGMSGRSSSFSLPSAGEATEEVSEISVVREYLLAGRLHRAITFGLDVPSILFADPLAKDCPPGPSFQGNSDVSRLHGNSDEDAVLYDRVLSDESTLMYECELDYGRVLASKITKLVVPKDEMDSSIVKTMLAEMLASCILGPVMGCFVPDSVNGWLIKGLGLLSGAAADSAGAESNQSPVSADAASSQYAKKSTSSTSDEVFLKTADAESEDSDLLDRIVDDVLEEIGSDGSANSQDPPSSLFGIEHNEQGILDENASWNMSEQIITALSMSIVELGSCVDFDDCRLARERNQDCFVDWDAPNCCDAVKHLVLIIEAALLHGARSAAKLETPSRSFTDSFIEMESLEVTLETSQDDMDDFSVDVAEELRDSDKVRSRRLHQHSSLSAALMELTGDIDTFQGLVEDAEMSHDGQSTMDGNGDDDSNNDTEPEIYVPRPNELSTLRTLIAAWLHTGQAYKVLSIIVKAKRTILEPFYHCNAFLRGNYSAEFIKLLRKLDAVDILVDTMAVLASPCLLLNPGGLDSFIENTIRRPSLPRTNYKGDDQFPGFQGRKATHPAVADSNPNLNPLSVVGSVKANFVNNRDRIARFAQSASEIDLNPFKDRNVAQTSGSSIAYNLHQNSQQLPAYLNFNQNEVFASSLRSERDRRTESWLREIKDRNRADFVSRTKGAKDKDTMMHRELHHLARYFLSNTSHIRIESCSFDNMESSESAANVILKAVSSRRKVEVPDEDSSFLLRAQPRPLKPLSIQREQRNPQLASKVYVAVYEQPALHPKTKRFYGGKYLRQCLMRYYPNDRTASISTSENLVLDGRQDARGSQEEVLSLRFQNTKHACLKLANAGLLSSPLMEPNDFCSTSRAGRAVDFAYKTNLYEDPKAELGGKKFIVRNASSPRADASSLELSDASLTASIIMRGSCGLNVCDVTPGSFNIKVCDNGTPLVLLRASRESGSAESSKAKDEARPYRPSFIRAALLVRSAKVEASSQCLLHCIKTGSTRAPSKPKSDEWLQPALTLLHYANSRNQQQQSVLLRDMRFGINHIDRGQLSRNGILNPRFPTALRGLNTKVEGAVEMKSSDFDLLNSPLILFKIRCTAIVEYIGDGEDADEVDEKGRSKARYFREEWTVLRSLREFSVFHKHLKGQVSTKEHSMNTGAKLVGAATAVFQIGPNDTNDQQRGPFIPSLSAATKQGNLGLSNKRLVEKRTKLLDQYLRYLASPNNLLSRCPELLKFLGAYTNLFPFSGTDKAGPDSYGRDDIRRVELVTEKLKVGIVLAKDGSAREVTRTTVSTITTQDSSEGLSLTEDRPEVDDNATVSTLGNATVTQEEPTREEMSQSSAPQDSNYDTAAKKMAMMRASEIKLKDVRRSLFRLLKFLFDLDNASFFRSRVISVLKTMSHAVASAHDFQVLLYDKHLHYMNGEWFSNWINYFLDMFWPDGVFYTKAPPLTENEIAALKRNSKDKLEKMFPDQLRTVLGTQHTEEGLDMLHEMLQYRIVLKSMAYQLLDLLWLEFFPELKDFVTGVDALEKE